MRKNRYAGLVGILIAGITSILAGSWLRFLVFAGEIPPSPSAAEHRVWTAFGITGPDFLLLGLVLGGVLAAVFSSNAGRNRRSGLLFQLTGILGGAVTLWRLLEVTGPDGVWADSYVIGPGVYLTLLGAILLVIGGSLLPRIENPRTMNTRLDRDAPGGIRHVPLAVVVLMILGTVAALVGTWLAWSAPFPQYADDGFDVIGPGLSHLDGLLLAITVFGVLASLYASAKGREYRRMVASPLLFLLGLLWLIVPYGWIATNELDWVSYHLDGPGLFVSFVAGVIFLVAGGLAHDLDLLTPSARAEPLPRSERLRGFISNCGPVTALGVVGVVAGTRLAWLLPIPDTSAPTPGSGSTMEFGIAGTNGVLLLIVVGGALVALALSGLPSGRRASEVALFGTGFLGIVQTGWRLLVTTGPDGVVRGAFVVGPGVYVTLCGCVLLAIVGATAIGGTSDRISSRSVVTDVGPESDSTTGARENG